MAKKPFNNRRAVGPIDVEVGNRLRMFRLERGLSQDKVADALGLTFQQIQKYEKGTNRLSVGRLIEFSTLFKTNPLEIIGWGNRPMGSTLDVESFKLAQVLRGLQSDLKGPVRALIMKLIDAGH